MASRTRLFFGVLALAMLVGACDAKSPSTPSIPSRPSISTVKMLGAFPQEGASLTYGSFGSQVEVHYTVADEFSTDLTYGGVIILSCLSEDGQNIIRDSCAGKLIHEPSGTVRNNPGLESYYRGTINQTRYIVNQLRPFRDDSVVVSMPMPWVWNFE